MTIELTFNRFGGGKIHWAKNGGGTCCHPHRAQTAKYKIMDGELEDLTCGICRRLAGLESLVVTTADRDKTMWRAWHGEARAK